VSKQKNLHTSINQANPLYFTLEICGAIVEMELMENAELFVTIW
jgi:hypothetical protein